MAHSFCARARAAKCTAACSTARACCMACMRWRSAARSAAVGGVLLASRQVCASPVFQLPKAPAVTGWLCSTYQPLVLPALSPSTRKRCTLPSSCRSSALCGTSPAPHMASSMEPRTMPRLTPPGQATTLRLLWFWRATTGAGNTPVAFSFVGFIQTPSIL